MTWFSYSIVFGILFSSMSHGMEFIVDTSPTILGAAKFDGSYTNFACYNGPITETWVSVPVSGFNDFKVETQDDDINLKPGAVRIIASAFSSKRVRRTLSSATLDSRFKNDGRCKTDIFLGYEIGGVIRLSKEFSVAVSDMEQAKKILESVQSLEDFYDVNLSSIKSLSGTGGTFGSSDAQLDLSPLYTANSREQFIKSASEVVKSLNDLYPADRAYRLEFSRSSVINVYLGRP